MRWMLFLAPVAGIAQFIRGRMAYGAMLFAAWMAALNGALVLGPSLAPEGLSYWISLVSWIVFAAVVGVSVADVLRHTHPRRIETFEQKKKSLLMNGITAYLKDDLDEAVKHFGEMAKMDIDDAEARMFLAMAYRARGDVALARRNFRRCRALSRGKWSWEVGEELKSLRKQIE